MQLGQFDVPEARLNPECIHDVKTIYDAIGSDDTTSMDIAKILGYATNATGAFYRRFNSLGVYGLIDRHGKFTVSALGKRLAYPESEMDRKMALKESILHVPLWAELFKKFGKSPPSENLWVQIKNITGVEAPLAQKYESQIRKWYLEDVSQITEDVMTIAPQKSYMQPDGTNTMQVVAGMGTSVEATIEIPFGKKYAVKYPATMHPREALEKIKQYMDIFIEDYEAEQAAAATKTSEEKTESEAEQQT